MARNISKEGFAQKIEKVEKVISRNREQYNKLTAELDPRYIQGNVDLEEE